MEQGGRRRAFGSICPNTVQGLPARLAKKPARPGGDTAWTPPAALSPRAPPPRPRRSGASPAAAAPALDVSTLMPPSLDCTDYDFSLGEEVAFGPCTPQLQSSTLVQVPPQNLSSPEPCWKDLADQHKKALGDALEANSQLQETLSQRQEELVALRESNVQLKELASQARQLAAVLDTLMLPQSADGTVLPPLPPLHPLPPPPAAAAAAAAAAAPAGTGLEDAEGVDAMLRAVSEKCRAALRSLGGSAGDGSGGSPGSSPGHSPGGSPTAKRPRPGPRLHGAFRGLRTGRAAPRPAGRELEEGGSLRTALGEAGAIRTLAFPQGNAFTLRTAAGGHRFRWVPR
ncbi:multicilin [Motacilla alba alba]|uniref:multicilin n=1 Tax=Motacilla alba alba TaxID=1094192 RepID=UPI0018D51A7A|nr:multicilin [Motacilla alba alba]